MEIILASKSPRRIEMMRKNGFDPIIRPSSIEENIPVHDGMTDTPLFLSFKKASDVASRLEPDLLAKNPYVIAADTIVYSDHIIGKPEDKEDALKILMDLSGKTHHVITGVSIIKAGTSVKTSFASITSVTFKSYEAEELTDYLETDEPYDKAGAYAIQGYFSRYVDRFEGSYDNVVGFPWEEIRKKLEELEHAGIR